MLPVFDNVGIAEVIVTRASSVTTPSKVNRHVRWVTARLSTREQGLHERLQSLPRLAVA